MAQLRGWGLERAEGEKVVWFAWRGCVAVAKGTAHSVTGIAKLSLRTSQVTSSATDN